MTLQRGDTGPAVRHLQQQLIALGYPMPKWGADGELGLETLGALALFMRDHALERPDPDDAFDVVSDEELALVARVATAPVGTIGIDRAKFKDLRVVASRKHVFGRRPWSKVTGITLHQTACVLGERPERWATVGCHVGVTRGGQVIHLHDFDELVVHGNGFNSQTVGIECDGLYAGVEGDLSTVWDDPTTPRRETPNAVTAELVDAAKATVRWIVAEVARHGGQVRALVAHRQSSASRRNDPGEALWKAVALPLHAELDLTDGGIGFAIGAGRPIPEVWDPHAKGFPY